MKKYISLFITFLMILSCLGSTVFAAYETEIIKIKGQEVIAGGQGVGYYDSSDAGTLETSGTSAVVLCQGEWTAHDISLLETGYYKIYIMTASASASDLTIAVGEKTYDISLAAGQASVYSKKLVAEGIIESGSELLKVTNNSDSSLKFMRLELEKTISVDTDIEIENVMSDAHDVGFHDNGERPNGIDKLELSTMSGRGTVCLRNDEWTAYDISSLSKGTYIVSLTKSCTSDVYANIYVDSYVEIKDATALASKDYAVFTESCLGIIHLNDDAQVLQIENVGNSAFYADMLRLSKISDEHTLNPEIKNFGNNVYSHVEGEGYHDEGGLPFSDSRMQTGKTVILHAKDWAAYDVSNIKSGVYDVVVSVGTTSTTTLNVLTDGNNQQSGGITKTGAYGNYVEFQIGKIYLDGAQKLTIENQGAGSVYLQYFKLKKSGLGIDDMYVHSIKPTGVISGGQGVGYYDNLDLDINNGGALETSGEAVTLRASEWLKYDVSKMRAGEYLVYADASNQAVGALSASFDMPEDEVNVSIASTGDYNVYQKTLIGKLNLTEETNTLKIENISSASTIIKEITLEYIPFYENLKITEDAQGMIEADRLYGNDTLYISGSFENAYYTSNGVKVISAFYDEEGRLLSSCLDYIDTKIGEKENVSIPVAVDDSAAKMKVLLWRSIDRVKPLLTEKTVYAGWDTHYYVDAENGNDANGGTTEKTALKTIEAAQTKVRAKNDNMLGDIYVHLSGEFKLTEPIAMTTEDSGTNGFSVIYDGGGEASVSGGRKVEGFSSVAGTPLYKAKVENADFRQLYVNGNRAQRARSKWLYYPKSEYIIPGGAAQLNSEVDGYVLSKDDFKDDFSRISDMEFIWMPSWKNIRMPVENMERNDDGDYVVTFKQPYFDSTLLTEATQPQPSLGIPFYIENAPEYLDEAGEWYYNKDTEELFYYPLATDNMADASVFIPETEMLLSASGNENEKVQNITFEGIEFKYGAWNRTTEKGFVTSQAEQMIVAETKGGVTSYVSQIIPAQVKVEYGNNINFNNNKFCHLASVALALDNATENSSVSGNVFDDISASAVVLSDADFVANSPIEDFVRDVKVKNNLIRRVSVEYMTPAITAYYVNNTEITHNDILDTPYSGISLGWGWGRGVKNCADNLIANNKIENVLYKLKDGGHIYTLDILSGTVIENNYMIKSGEWKGGIYLDNATENLLIRNNVFEDCEKWLKLTWHNVKNNTAYNNYSETGMACTYPDINSIEEAIGKTDGAWPDAALDIILNAGLEDEYDHLLTEYNKNTHFRNAELKRLSYIAKSGVIVPAGELIPGGEGVAYHDIVSSTSGIGITDSYDGTGHRYIMNTTQGEWTKHKVTIPSDGTYKVILNAGATSNLPRVSIWIDDELVVNKGTIKNTGSYAITAFADNELASVNLKAGEHIIKVEHTTSNFAFYSLRFVEEGKEEFIRNDGFVAEVLNAINGNN